MLSLKMVCHLVPRHQTMSKVLSFRFFRKSQYFWLRASSFPSSVPKLLLFSFFYLTFATLLQAPSGNYLSSPAYAQSSAEQITPQESHRLENFLISTKGRDEWNRLMLAILNSVPAVESVLSQGVSINIRGTDEFQGVTPLMFASGIGAQVIVVVS